VVAASIGNTLKWLYLLSDSLTTMAPPTTPTTAGPNGKLRFISFYVQPSIIDMKHTQKLTSILID
jgi:hypothetical protein